MKSCTALLVLITLATWHGHAQKIQSADLITGEEVVWVDAVSCHEHVYVTPIVISRADTIGEVLWIIGSNGSWLIKPRLMIDALGVKGIRCRTWLNEAQYAGNYVERFTVRVTDSLLSLTSARPFVRLVGEMRTTDSLNVTEVTHLTHTLIKYVRRLQKGRLRD